MIINFISIVIIGLCLLVLAILVIFYSGIIIVSMGKEESGRWNN